MSFRSAVRRRVAVPAVVGAMVAGSLIAGPLSGLASANPANSGLVINEVYLNGGSAGATYLNKFVELYNPTAAPIDLAGLSLQYRATGATSVFGQVNALSGTVPAGETFLLQGPSNAANGAALPTPDGSVTLNPSGTAGAIALVAGTTALAGVDGSVTGNPAVVDLIGWGTAAKSYETAVVAPGINSVTVSLNRTGGADIDNNSTDFTGAAPTPTPSGGTGPIDPGDPDPTPYSIAQIQGSGAASPVAGTLAVTTGVVTATYPTGGYNGFYLQTGGTGGDPVDDPTPGASDGIFVFGSATVAGVAMGDSVQVTGTVSEFNGLTEITPGSVADVVDVAPLPPVKATETDYPATDTAREALEGMLIHPVSTYTVTDNFSLNTFGSFALALGDQPLYVPTEVARPGTPERLAVIADNAARKVVLDDGASVSFLSTANGGANKNIPLPWIDADTSIRVGAQATFVEPVILDFRNSAWNFQPVQQLTAGDTNGVTPVTFSGGDRPTAPEAVGGDIKIGTFNVLNYFTTTGVDYETATGLDCTSFDDRAGNGIGVNSCDGDAGPRGAWDQASLERQQAKIVTAINALGADVVSLEEIENSVKFGVDRDDALSALVDALNAAAGGDVWAFVPSPDASALPAVDDQDVIRTAFIYQPAAVTPSGTSTVLVGTAAFADAREPLAQAFVPVAGSPADTFLVIVNHFKSKGSGADDGTGQGNANPDRVAQATALVGFAADMQTSYGTDKVYLTGDFNSYSEEDPVQVIKDAGYADLESTFTTKDTYSFGGEVGSLDHVYASPAAAATVTGLDVWNINAYESVAYEYSRYNYNATLFYGSDPYRASDHDPVVLGVDVTEPIVRVDPTVAISAPSVRADQPATVTVTVTADGVQPTGTVDLVVNGGAPVSSSVDAAGVATFDLGTLPVGTYPLTATYSGDAAVNSGSTTGSLVVTAALTPSTTTATTSAVAYGTSAKVRATVTAAGVTPTGTVTVSENGVVLGSAALSGGKATVVLGATALAPGSHTLTVGYGGSASVAGSQTTVTIIVGKAPSLVLAANTTPLVKVKTTKAIIAVRVLANGGVPVNGPVTVYSGGTAVGTGTVTNGVATVQLSPFSTRGIKVLAVSYGGSDTVAASTGVVLLFVF